MDSPASGRIGIFICYLLVFAFNLGIKADSIKAEQVSCSVVSMSFFDRLQENGIIRENGSIVKCFDEFCDGFTISDELRKVFCTLNDNVILV